MDSRRTLLTGFLWVIFTVSAEAHAQDSIVMLSGVIYNESFQPVAATHVINLNTYAGDATDSLGIFSLPVFPGDTLMIRNIVYRDTLVPAARLIEVPYITLRVAYYPIEEAKIFPWGSTYGDFREAIIKMPDRQTLGESMGLPRQDPEYVPFDMDEESIKSLHFLIHTPINFLYYNLSRKEKSRRKVYWLNRNKEKYEIFNDITSPESVSEITGLKGDALLEFLAFLYQQMDCDFKCDEFSIFSEIYKLWEAYQHPE